MQCHMAQGNPVETALHDGTVFFYGRIIARDMTADKDIDVEIFDLFKAFKQLSRLIRIERKMGQQDDDFRPFFRISGT